jgi:predicted O-methyltransferase YrrM
VIRPRVAQTRMCLLLLSLLSLPGIALSNDEPSPYRFSTDWFTPNAANWEEHLGHLKGRPGLAYLEIGPYEGQSFFWVLDNFLTHPTSRATAIDIFAKGESTHYQEDYETAFRRNLALSGASERVTVIKGRSQTELRELALQSFDLVYIDGSHATRDVLTDLVLSWDLLREDGLLVLDDYLWGKGKKWPRDLRPQFAIEAFITAYSREVEVVDRAYQVILRKRPDRCQQVHYEGCSYIGPYFYDWRKRALIDPKTMKRKKITREETSLIESILRSRVMGRPQPAVGAALRADPNFIALNEKLGLGL